jgi:hypothetical protein
MRLLVAPGASLAILLATASALGAEDDLPVGSELPRVVPVVVADSYYAIHDPGPLTKTATLATTASRHNEINVNLLAVGARLEHAKLTGAAVLHAGTSVDALYDNGPLSARREIFKHIQLANVGWKTGDFHFEAGVLPSLVGRESFISAENWNYTRAIIADATPYYVTGLRATWRFIPTMSASLTAFNGWDAHGDRNNYKSGQLRLSWFPSEKLTVDNTVLAGVEQTLVGNEKVPVRIFEDLVIAYQLHKRIQLALEGYFGTEQNYEVEDRRKGTLTQKSVLRNPSWFGGALWARWQFAETTYVAVRGEGIDDAAGVITGRGARGNEISSGGPSSGPAPGQQILAGTVTLGWHPHPKLLARVEAMHRAASERYFAGGDPQTHDEFIAETGQTLPFISEAKKSSTTFVVSATFSY